MTVFKKFTYLAIVSALLPSCRSSRSAKICRPTVELRKFHFAEVSLQELIENKAFYHGKLVETSGYARFGFEESAIYYDMDIPTLDSVQKFRNECGLWIKFVQQDSPDFRNLVTLNDKLVKVKGLFDTTKTGHVGGCYRAELTDAFDLVILKNKWNE